MTKEKRAIIVGASSGIGYEVARLLLQEGWRLGLAARRTETLEALRREFQDQVVYAPIDVTQEESEERLLRLIDAVGGIWISTSMWPGWGGRTWICCPRRNCPR